VGIVTKLDPQVVESGPNQMESCFSKLLLGINFVLSRLLKSIDSIRMFGQKAQHFLLNPRKNILEPTQVKNDGDRLTPHEDKRNAHAVPH